MSTSSAFVENAYFIILLYNSGLASNLYDSLFFSFAIPIYMRPTGFVSVAPSGPAIPVVDIAIVQLYLFNKPSAISIATCALTTPFSSIVLGFTPKIETLAELAYVTKFWKIYVLEP